LDYFILAIDLLLTRPARFFVCLVNLPVSPTIQTN
jgi:hypothetical protein